MSSLSTNSSTSSSSLYSTSTSSKRVTGLMSGLDTDELVKQLTIGLQNKIDSQLQKKQLALWQQTAYQNVTKAVSEFQSKYFASASSSSSILNAGFFNSSSITNTSPYVNVSGSAAAAKNMKIASITSLAKQASYTTTGKVSGQAITTGEIKESWEGKSQTIAAGSKLNIKIDGKPYALTLTSAITLSADGNGASDYEELQKGLNAAIKSNADLEGKVKFSVGSSGEVSLSSTDSSTVTVTGGSQNLLNGLGLTAAKNEEGIITGYNFTGNVDKTALTTAYLSDSLAGSTLTFDLNGLSRTITFDESKTDTYDTVEKLQSYLDGKLESAFGKNKITLASTLKTVDGKTTGSFSFTTAEGGNDVLSITSSSKSGVLGVDGALRVYAGESNRINLNKTLRDAKGELANGKDLKPSDSGTYDISVNGKVFSFKETDTINSIVNKINNDADANVTISYSSTLDRFSITAKSGGESSKVEISDVTLDENGNAVLDTNGKPVTGKSNLSKVLFGNSSVEGSGGKDAELSVIFDGDATATTIKRSSNSFTMDGVNFELLKTTPFKTDESGNPTETPDIEPITFTSQNKTDDLVSKIKTFVDDYNAILTTVNGYISEKKPTDAKYLPLTDAQKSEMKDTQITDWEKKAKQGLLFNDSLLSNFAQDWRHGMTDVVSSMSSALYELGISSASYSDNGKLTVDEDKLQKVINSDPDKVTQLFTGTDGIATRMKSIITKYTNDSLVNTGLLITKAGSSTSTVDQSELATRMKEYDTQVSTLKLRLTSQQEYYYNKFTALETYISQMNSQASFFTSSSST